MATCFGSYWVVIRHSKEQTQCIKICSAFWDPKRVCDVLLYVGNSFPSSHHVSLLLLHSSHDRSNWYSRSSPAPHCKIFRYFAPIFRRTDHVRNEDVLLRVKEQRNILHEISKRKVNWIGHILRRNCFLQRGTKGKIQGRIEVTGRQGRRRMKLLD
jgi:hypothetical protein